MLVGVLAAIWRSILYFCRIRVCIERLFEHATKKLTRRVRFMDRVIDFSKFVNRVAKTQLVDNSIIWLLAQCLRKFFLNVIALNIEHLNNPILM